MAHRLVYAPTEAEMQTALDDYAKARGGFSWHINRSDFCPEMVNFWDSTVLVPGTVYLLELKTNDRPFIGRQRKVADLLTTVSRVVCGVVRPDPKPGEYSYDELVEIMRRF